VDVFAFGIVVSSAREIAEKRSVVVRLPMPRDAVSGFLAQQGGWAAIAVSRDGQHDPAEAVRRLVLPH
jgi:hypothetical protein